MKKIACFAAVLAACGGAHPAAPEAPQRAAPAPVASSRADAIRQIDFKNFTYPNTDCGPAVTVKDGTYTQDADPDDRVYFDVRDVVFGDLTGDGVDDAVVVTNCNTGGTGQFSAVTVWVLRDGKPAALETVASGDRADGGIAGVRIEHGALVIQQYAASEGGGACCPGFVNTTSYRWSGQKFLAAGPSTRAPVNDGQPHS